MNLGYSIKLYLKSKYYWFSILLATFVFLVLSRVFSLFMYREPVKMLGIDAVTLFVLWVLFFSSIESRLKKGTVRDTNVEIYKEQFRTLLLVVVTFLPFLFVPLSLQSFALYFKYKNDPILPLKYFDVLYELEPYFISIMFPLLLLLLTACLLYKLLFRKIVIKRRALCFSLGYWVFLFIVLLSGFDLLPIPPASFRDSILLSVLLIFGTIWIIMLIYSLFSRRRALINIAIIAFILLISIIILPNFRCSLGLYYLGWADRPFVLRKQAESEHFIYRFSSNSVALNEVGPIAATHEWLFDKFTTITEVEYPSKIHSYLYTPDLKLARLGMRAPCALYFAHEIHNWYTYRLVDPGLQHEMMHLFTHRFIPYNSYAHRSRNFGEAVASIGQVRHTDSPNLYSAFLLQKGLLIPLWDIFNKKSKPGRDITLNTSIGYLRDDFINFVYQKYGIEKIKQLARIPLDSEDEFKKEIQSLEEEWHKEIKKVSQEKIEKLFYLQREGLVKYTFAAANQDFADRISSAKKSIRKGKEKEAMELFYEILNEIPDKESFIFIVTRYLYGQKKYNLAKEWILRNMPKLLGDSHIRGILSYYLGSIFEFQKDRDLAQAKIYYQQAVDYNSSSFSHGVSAWKLNLLQDQKTYQVFRQGRESLNRRKYQEAIRSFEKVLQINPNHYQTYRELGICYDSLFQSKKSIEYYKKALEMGAGKFKPYDLIRFNFSIGNHYYYLEEYKKALEYFGRADKIRQQSIYRYDPKLSHIKSDIEKTLWIIDKQRKIR